MGVEGGEVGALARLYRAEVRFHPEEARRVERGEAREVGFGEAERAGGADGVEHGDDRAGDAAALVARATGLDRDGLAPDAVLAVAEARGRDRVADERDARRRLAAQDEAEHERVAVDAVGDEVYRHVVSEESPADRPRLAVVERRHRVEEVRHVSRPGRARTLQRLDVRARV